MLLNYRRIKPSSALIVTLMLCGVCAAFAETSVGKAATQTKSKKILESAYRLSDNVIPSKYQLEFEPDAANGKFSGTEDVEITVNKPAKSIILNAHQVLVKNAILVQEKKSMPLQVLRQPSLQRVTFTAISTITPGKYHLRCTFNGTLNDEMRGFYRSTFKDKNNKTHYLAVTQMEPTDARRMFPCFDEPALKAVFKIKARIPAENTAISNAPVSKESIEKSSGKKVVEFEESPPMSTYLLALLIGEFKPTEAVESEGIPIRVWSVNHDPAMGNYARDHAVKLLKYLNGYFRIPYPWKKLDLIAIPDFQSGAMENPGAITFREKFLLLDDKEAALSTKQDTVGITAHEMAHLWFGDLVTMKWWDDIWLNEAFATWMATKATDHIAPEWNVMSAFFNNRQKAFLTDALHSTRTIQSPVIKPEDATQMFDEITYVKGAAVLRMLEYYLGESTFQNGVSAYLKEHSFKNAATDDLWRALQKASNKPVKEIMDTWCKQPGYPLLISSADGNGTRVQQQRFFLDGKNGISQSWKVPIGYREIVEPKKDEFGRDQISPEYQLFSAPAARLKVDSGEFLNAGGYGFYRTYYKGKSAEKLKSNINAMSAAERLCFLSDHLALAPSGKIPVNQYLDLLKSYRTEKDFAVLDTLVDSLKQIDRYIKPSARPAFSHVVCHLLKDEYNRLGWESKPGEPATERLSRAKVITALGTMGNDNRVIAKSRQIFNDYLKTGSTSNPDVLDAVTDIVAYNGTKTDFDTFKNLWLKASTPEIEHRNQFALAKFRQKDLITAGLALTLSKEVRKQDAPKLLAEFFSDNEAKVLAWKFMKSNWSKITKMYSPHMLPKLVEALASLNTQSEYDEVKAFFTTHKVPEGTASVNRMIEKLQINVSFGQRSSKAINEWFERNKSI